MNDPAVPNIPRPAMRPRGMTRFDVVDYETRFAIKHPSGCLIATGTKSRKGYAQTALCGKNIRVHRAVLEVKLGHPLGALHALHICNRTDCINPAHLYAGRNDDNVRDRLNDRWVYSKKAKLTKAEAFSIRRRYAAGGTSFRKLAAAYNVNQSSIRDIIVGKTWVQGSA